METCCERNSVLSLLFAMGATKHIECPKGTIENSHVGSGGRRRRWSEYRKAERCKLAAAASAHYSTVRACHTPVTTGGFCVKRTALRSVALCAPYMHNASIAALAEPVRHYETGGIDPQVVRHAASNPANRPRATRPSCVYGNIEW